MRRSGEIEWVKLPEFEEERNKVEFECWNRRCIINLFKALNMQEALEKILEELKYFKYWPYRGRAKIVFTSVTDWVWNDSCSASLTSSSEWYITIGEVEKVAEWEDSPSQCGPSTYSTPAYKYRLAPGSVVAYFKTGYTGERRDDKFIIYINPPPGYKISKHKIDDIVIHFS